MQTSWKKFSHISMTYLSKPSKRRVNQKSIAWLFKKWQNRVIHHFDHSRKIIIKVLNYFERFRWIWIGGWRYRKKRGSKADTTTKYGQNSKISRDSSTVYTLFLSLFKYSFLSLHNTYIRIIFSLLDLLSTWLNIKERIRNLSLSNKETWVYSSFLPHIYTYLYIFVLIFIYHIKTLSLWLFQHLRAW